MLMTLLQVVFALCVCLVLRLFGAISFGARNSGRPMLRFAGAWCCIAMLFVGSLYSSNELVRRTDVEFVIAARSLTALVIAALEPLLLRSPWPNGAAVLCLVGIASFATAFAWVMQHGELADRAPPDVWTWTVLYIAFVSAESIAGKAMIDSESGLTPWGLTLCSNGFALCVLPVYIAMTGRLRPQSGESSMHYWRHWAHVLQPMLDGWRAPVGWFASCVLGTGISFFAMSTRRLVSVRASPSLATLHNRAAFELHASAQPLCSTAVSRIYPLTFPPRGSPPPRNATASQTARAPPSLPPSLTRLPSHSRHAQLSAAQFTVLGVANKFATILFDHFVQVKSHTTVRGSLFLVCTIVTSLLYGIATNAARRQRESGVFSADRKRGRDDDPGAGEKGEGVAHYVARDARRGDANGDCAKDGANAIELRALLGTTTFS